MGWISLRRSLIFVACYVLIPAVLLAGMLGWRALRSSSTELADRFTITSFDADYTVTSSVGQIAKMSVVEAIVADFPHRDVNHGIIRELPGEYRGRSLRPTVQRVTDSEGVDLPWTIAYLDPEDKSEGVAVRIGDPVAYVNGRQSYRIMYTYERVIQNVDDIQELYWDVNGDAWRQSVAEASATLHLPAEFGARLTGDLACYGADDAPCDIRAERAADGSATVSAKTSTLGPEQSMTIAVGFQPGTARDRIPTGTRIVEAVVFGIAGLAALTALTLGFLAATRTRRWMRGRVRLAQFVIPQHLPPALASEFYGAPSRGIVAEVLRAAISGQIKLSQGRADEPLWATREGEVKGGHPLSDAALKLALGSAKKSVLAENLASDDARGAYALRRTAFLKGKSVPVSFSRLSSTTVIAIAAAGGYLLFVLGTTSSMSVPAALLAWLIFGISAAIIYGVLAKWVSLKPSGHDDFAYLEGMRDYIAMTDERRLAVLQSADTAQRTAGDEIVLYEKLLPYAAVFGLEDTWRERMQGHYAVEAPTWLEGDVNSAVRGGSDRDWGARSVPAAGSGSGYAARDRSSSSGGGRGGGSSRSSGGSRGGGRSGGGGGGGGGRGW